MFYCLRLVRGLESTKRNPLKPNQNYSLVANIINHSIATAANVANIFLQNSACSSALSKGVVRFSSTLSTFSWRLIVLFFDPVRRLKPSTVIAATSKSNSICSESLWHSCKAYPVFNNGYFFLAYCWVVY